MTASPLRNHYGVIYADPPWTFATYSAKGKGRSAEAYYDCMTLDSIKALPVAKWAAEDCALFLWKIRCCHRHWRPSRRGDFAYKTIAFTWAKRTPRGTAWHF